MLRALMPLWALMPHHVLCALIPLTPRQNVDLPSALSALHRPKLVRADVCVRLRGRHADIDGALAVANIDGALAV